MKYPEKEAYNRKTAKRLKAERRAKKVTQNYIAEKMEITLDHYKKMEAGIKIIEMWRLQKLHDDPNCQLDIDYIIFGTRKKEEREVNFEKNAEKDIEKDFYCFVRKYQNREIQLVKILLAYIDKCISYKQERK